jgi:diguanylate cyclase (GGDEF)-like protein
VEVRVRPVPGSDGRIVGAVEIFTDNSRQRAVREKARELATWAFLDAASQVANRRFLEMQLTHYLNQYAQCGTPFGIVLMDLDGFKEINDTYGHPAGDLALVTVAKTLAGCLRASDVLGRWGGDEFLIILPGVTSDYLADTSERCRALVARSTLLAEGAQCQVTISVGATMAGPGDSEASLLSRVDRKLYNSKQSGRNRVSL